MQKVIVVLVFWALVVQGSAFGDHEKKINKPSRTSVNPRLGVAWVEKQISDKLMMGQGGDVRNIELIKTQIGDKTVKSTFRAQACYGGLLACADGNFFDVILEVVSDDRQSPRTQTKVLIDPKALSSSGRLKTLFCPSSDTH